MVSTSLVYTAFDTIQVTDEVHKDIIRICEIWQEAQQTYRSPDDGNFLFGHFTIADAFFAPVVFRFHTYAPVLPSYAEIYCQSILRMPEVIELFEAAQKEDHRVEQYDK